MASAVIHGDLAGQPMPPLDRPVYFLNAMFASGNPGQDERFPDRLPEPL